MKTLFRNFIYTLKRFRLASVLNILGLSVAFAAFMVIMMQVRYDRSFDRFHARGDRTYRVEFIFEGDRGHTASLSRPMIDLMMQTPQVEAGALLQEFGTDEDQIYVTVDGNGEKVGFKELVSLAFPEFTRVFDFEMVEGDPAAFERPDRVLIPHSMARRMFGQESALERRMEVNLPFLGVYEVTVGGVYRDFPSNTLLRNSIYMPQDPNRRGEDDYWWSMGYSMFMTLHSPGQKAEVEAAWLSQLNAVEEVATWFPIQRMQLTLIPDIYYATDIESDTAPKGNKAATGVLLGIALLIIIIAAINFVNFSTSLAPMRIKSINTQKVLGAPTATLRRALVGEAVGTCLMAFALSVLWSWLLSQSSFTQFLTAPLTLAGNLPVVGLTLGVALAVGILAGLYPAWHTTSFPPALVLKGSFGMSPQGRKLRTTLVGFQFVVSIGLIIAALFMQIQNGFLRSMDTGLDTSRIAVAVLPADVAENGKATLRNRLVENPQIEQVAFAHSVLGSSDQAASRWNFGKPNEEAMNIQIIHSTWELPSLLDVKLLEGRLFYENETESEDGHRIIINRTAQQLYGIELGQVFPNSSQVVGIVEDFNFHSLRQNIEPMAFMLRDGGFIDWMYVKATGDPHATVDHIRTAVASLDPAYPTDVRFFDTVFDNAYAKERKTTGLVTIFSLLAVVISLVGVFGLVMFETQYRRKEIGVRKVMGATVSEILAMFNRKFVWIVAVCFLIAVPLARYGVVKWLGTFAYRTPLHWWVFVLSLLIVMLVTLTTVTIQSWRAATSNPVHALRSE